MSHAATNWAIRQRGLKPAAKIVLWHLADCHNGHTGQCNPRQSTLSDMCEMSRSTLNVHLAELERRGLIRRVTEIDPVSKRQRPTHYVLAMDDPESPASGNRTRTQDIDPRPQDIAEPCPKTGHGAESGNGAEPCPDFGQSRVRNPDSIENPGMEPGMEPCAPAHIRDSGFQNFVDRFLQAHPRPGDRDATGTALRKVIESGVDPELLIKSAEAYGREQARNDPAFVSYSENWLVKGRWKNYLPKYGPTAADIAQSLAANIRSKQFWVRTHISDAKARELIAQGLVTLRECEEAGLRP